MPKPLVSICIPVYNGEKYLAETIKSVIEQTYKNIEIVINDNCSEDESYKIACDFASIDSRIKVYRNSENISMAANWNNTFEKTSGDFLCLLSADDLLDEFFVEKGIEIIKQTQAHIYTANHLILKNNVLTNRKMKTYYGLRKNYTSEIMLLNPFSINFTIFSRKIYTDLLEKNNYFFNEKFWVCDYDLWLRMSGNYTIFYDNTPLGKYRVHENNLSRNQLKMNRQVYKVLRQNKSKLIRKSPFIFTITLARILSRIIYIRFRNKLKFSN